MYFSRTMSRLSWLQWTLDDSKLSLISRIFRTTVSFLPVQFRHKMFVKSEPSPLDISAYLLSGDQDSNNWNKLWSFLPTWYRQFSFEIFVRNHFSTVLTTLICPFDAVGETHTHLILFWSEFQMSSDQLQVTPPLINYFLARNANENPSSETSRPLATSSLAQPLRDLKNGCFAA